MIPLMAYKRKYVTVYRYSLLAEALDGHPSKNSNNRGARWEEGKGGEKERVTGTCPYHWRGWRGDGLISGPLRWPCNGVPSRY